MRTGKKVPLVLAALKKGAIFKVSRTWSAGGAALDLDGVYQVSTARADKGESIHIGDLRTTRPLKGPGTSTKLLTLPIAEAQMIEVYAIRSN